MTAVYVLRHPETTWNVEQRYQGRLEAPLTDRGRHQAALTARAFAGRDLDAVYSSPLSRALELARRLQEATGAPLYVDQRFTEIAMGPWEGLYKQEIGERFPELFAEWYSSPDRVTFPGGESLEDVQARSLSALSHVFASHPMGDVCVVTHSAVVQVLLACALGLPLAHVHRMRIANAGISTLCGDGAPGQVLALNATDQLYGSAVDSAAALDCVHVRVRRKAS